MDLSSLFTIVAPGIPPINKFEQFNDNLICDLLNPGSFPTLAFSLNSPLPEGIAAVLYYSIPPFGNLQFIGALANNRPSDIFHTGFGLISDIASLPLLKLVIRGEQMDQKLRELVEMASNNDFQKEYAKKVAYNLYNYMSSFFNPSNEMNSHFYVPKDFLDKWLIKFNEKYKIDPFFILKTSLN